MHLAITTLLLAAVAPDRGPAARPASCGSGLGQSGYEAGYTAQTKVLTQLWSDHHESCEEIDAFKNKVTLALTHDPPPNVFLRCRRAGMIQAFEDAVAHIGLACTSTCGLDLGAYAQVSAQIFCEATASVPFDLALSQAGIATPSCKGDEWTTCQEKVKAEAGAACPYKVAAHATELDELASAACRSPDRGE
jgi:hypothetical protein